MNTDKHGFDAEKIRTDGNTETQREANAEARSWKDANGRTIDNMDWLVHRIHGTGADSRATPPISSDLLLISTTWLAVTAFQLLIACNVPNLWLSNIPASSVDRSCPTKSELTIPSSSFPLFPSVTSVFICVHPWLSSPQKLAIAFTGLLNAPVLQQQTLNRSASYSGVGLHSGNRVTMTFLPAPPNSGIRFRRVDLEGKPEIEARVENVVENNRSTTLAKGNTRIHTVEHVLATFAGFGIDNVVIELDSNEPPIADGSAREYCKLIESAGIVAQEERREPYSITAPIELEMGETVMTFFPDEVFKVSCTSADKEGRFTQFCSLEITPMTWERDVAHARTFCFFEEIEFLIKNGLIKGGSLENAVVIREDAVLTNEPLRYPDEFVRHKVLDIVGDLALLGRPVHGHLIAVKPSHAANCELVRRINAQMRKPLVAAQTFAPPPAPATPTPAKAAPPQGGPPEEIADGEGAMSIDGVLRVLPHRPPFLMVDRVIKIDGDKIVGLKNVTINEAYFQGHFPAHPVMPGVLQLEAIAQVAGILMFKKIEKAGQIAYFMSAEDVKWRKPVRPGDVLVIEVEMTKFRGKICKARGACKVRGEIVSEAEVTFMLAEL